MPFTNEQLERYSRHIILKEIGVKGQKKLMNGSVLIIGAGGLGAPAAMYLAAAGVGKIGIADADVVDLSNLQRQVIHTTNDLGKPKVESAAETMRAINPDVEVLDRPVEKLDFKSRRLVRETDLQCLLSVVDSWKFRERVLALENLIALVAQVAAAEAVGALRDESR